MLTTVEGIYRDGKIELLQTPASVKATRERPPRPEFSITAVPEPAALCVTSLALTALLARRLCHFPEVA